MPFTPAHAAALLPLKWITRWPLSWTALLLGAVVPDFEYFIWLSSAAFVSHTISGIFVFNLPFVFVLSFAWHEFVRPVLMPRLQFFKPDLAMEVIPDFSVWIRKNFLVFVFSALLGICSHLLWDSFCHANGWMVHRIPMLLEKTSVLGHAVRNCYLLWYLSTVFGVMVLLYWWIDFRLFFSATTWKRFFAGASFWGKVLFVAGLIAVLRITLGLGTNWTRHLVMIAIGSVFYALLLVCFTEHERKKKPQSAEPRL